MPPDDAGSVEGVKESILHGLVGPHKSNMFLLRVTGCSGCRMVSRGAVHRCIRSPGREDADSRRRFVWSSFILVSSRGSSVVFIKSS